MESNTNFRINAKNYFLTYPQCPIPKETLLTFLKEQRPTQYVCVASEQHADGSPHLHALVQYVAKYNCRNPRAFDYQSEGHTYHCNVQPAKDIDAVQRYIEKDGNVAKDGELLHSGKRKAPSYFDLLQKSATKADFMQSLLEHHSRDVFINLDRIEYAANKYFKASNEYVPMYTEFPNIPQELHDWYGGNFERPRPDRPKSLVLVGDSRLGKTQWARSLGIHAYMKGSWNAEKFKVSYDYIVIDDVDLSYWFRDGGDKSVAKAFFGCNGEAEVTGKYIKTFTVRLGCPVIFLMNFDQFYLYEHFINSDFGKTNICVIKLQNKLY